MITAPLPWLLADRMARDLLHRGVPAHTVDDIIERAALRQFEGRAIRDNAEVAAGAEHEVDIEEAGSTP